MRIVDKPQLIDTPAAADFIGTTAGTLALWRCLGRYSIPFVKVGGKVLYDVADLRAWLESRKRTNSTTER